MLRVSTLLLAFACAAFTTIACSDETPVSPTPSTTAQGQAVGADGSTLKVSAPNPVSPADGATLNTLKPTLEVSSAAARYTGQAVSYSYDFELQTASGTVRPRGNASGHDLGVPRQSRERHVVPMARSRCQE